MKIMVRKALAKDVGALRKIISNCWHPNFVGASDFWLKEETPTAKAGHIAERIRPPFKTFVAVDGERIVAFATTQKYRGRLWIGDIFVERGYQGKGVGKTLVKEIVKGEKEIYITVNDRNRKALKFWRALGFRPVLTEVLMVLK